MADAMESGAHAAAAEMEQPLCVTRRRAAEASVDDLLGADGYLFCAPENLASTSGEMLEFFHRTYYHAFEVVADGDEERSVLLGRPFGLAIAAGSDGTSAARQVERIATGWRLRRVADTFVHRNGLVQSKANILAPDKELASAAEARCREIGGLVAATLLL